MKTNCQDCGCSVYDGVCVNCHEETVILEQYIELEMDAPSKEFLAKVEQQKEQIKANKKSCKIFEVNKNLNYEKLNSKRDSKRIFN